MKELDASIKERKEEIERERLARSKRTPEQVLEAEQKAANNKKLAERRRLRPRWRTRSPMLSPRARRT